MSDEPKEPEFLKLDEKEWRGAVHNTFSNQLEGLHEVNDQVDRLTTVCDEMGSMVKDLLKRVERIDERSEHNAKVLREASHDETAEQSE
jgi:hypothetical protein